MHFAPQPYFVSRAMMRIQAPCLNRLLRCSAHNKRRVGKVGGVFLRRGTYHRTAAAVRLADLPRCGPGQIVFLALPGLLDSSVNGNSARFQPVTAKRMMFNHATVSSAAG